MQLAPAPSETYITFQWSDARCIIGEAPHTCLPMHDEDEARLRRALFGIAAAAPDAFAALPLRFAVVRVSPGGCPLVPWAPAPCTSLCFASLCAHCLFLR